MNRNMTVREMDAMIDEMAQKYKDDKKIDFDAAKAQLMEKLTGADNKMHGTTVRLSLLRILLFFRLIVFDCIFCLFCYVMTHFGDLAYNGNGVGRVNKVNLRRVHLVSGLVISSGCTPRYLSRVLSLVIPPWYA